MMAKYIDLHKSQQALEEGLAKRMAEFDAQLNQHKADATQNDSLYTLRKEFNSFRDLAWNLLSLLRHQVADCIKHIDNLETRSRRNMLVFTGVEEKPREDLKAIISDLLHNKLFLPHIPLSSIDLVYRLGVQRERPRSIIVKFMDFSVKKEVWRKKTALKGSNISIAEFLTKPRQAIFVKARHHFGIKKCWSMDGTVYVCADDNKKYKLVSLEDLEELLAKFPKPLQTEASPSSGKSTGENHAAAPRRRGNRKI